jgi:hypothetical protein
MLILHSLLNELKEEFSQSKKVKNGGYGLSMVVLLQISTPKGARHGKKQNSISKRVKLDRISLTIQHGITMLGGSVQNALASGFTKKEISAWSAKHLRPESPVSLMA